MEIEEIEVEVDLYVRENKEGCMEVYTISEWSEIDVNTIKYTKAHRMRVTQKTPECILFGPNGPTCYAAIVLQDIRPIATTFSTSRQGDHHNESVVQNKRDERSNVKVYTIEEDMKIIRYILENKWCRQDVKGPAMWELMAERKIVPSRTWQSLKERFTTFIQRNLEHNSYCYGLDEDQNKKLLFY